MTTEHALARVEPGGQPPATMGGSLVAIDPRVVAVAKRNLEILQDIVMNVMEEGIDYGRIPGTPGPGLWDAGASTLMDAFNVYAEPHILSQSIENGLLTIFMKVELISRDTKAVVATGVGAASGLEPKYGYRWLTAQEALQEAGIAQEMLVNLPTRKRRGDQGEAVTYRVPHPDPGELVNTIFKMAEKRAEVDAAQNLPQAKKALAKLFGRGDDGEHKATWRNFFGEIRRLGYTEEQAHDLLKVKSFKDWTSSGRTLEQAVAALREARQRGQAAQPGPARSQETRHPASTAAATVPAPQAPPDVDPETGEVMDGPFGPEPTQADSGAPVVGDWRAFGEWLGRVGHTRRDLRPALKLTPDEPFPPDPQDVVNRLTKLGWKEKGAQ